MENGFTYRLGLDIGIASVGAAVVQTNSFDKPCHLTEPNVRTFPAAECRENGKYYGNQRQYQEENADRLVDALKENSFE